MASETVRIKPETHSKLKDLAIATGQTMSEALEQAVENMRRERMLDETNRAYAALRDDPQAWKQELAEREAWDASLQDGLEKD